MNLAEDKNPPKIKKADRDAAKLGLIRKNLLAYTVATYPEYEINWHHRVLSTKLQEAAEQGGKRIIVCMPPRHGKSEIVSVRFPAWYLGNFPHRKIITSSYNQDFANDFGRKVRNLVIDPRHKAFFPELRTMQDAESMSKLDTTAGGGYVAAGVGGAITGRGANFIIIDDPIKDEVDASSATIRERIHEWYRSVIYTRLESDHQTKASIVLCMTRWHFDDLAGRLEQEEAEGGEVWEKIVFPAISPIDTPNRKANKALWPQRFDEEHLAKIKRTVGPKTWEALYQQKPSPDGGTYLKREWWRKYERLPDPRMWRRKVQVWDTAHKSGQSNDYSVCLTAIETDLAIYITDVFKARLEFPELKREARHLYELHGPMMVLVEDKSSGISLIQELKRESTIPVYPVKADRDKEARAHAATPVLADGRVYLNQKGKWVEDFIRECEIFPNGKHDDQVDAFTHLIQYLKFHRHIPEMRKKSPLHGGKYDPINDDDDEAGKQEKDSVAQGNFLEYDSEVA